MKPNKKQSFPEWWGGLSTPQRAAFVGLASVEFVLTTKAWLDLAKRPRDQIRGPKAAWLLVSFVQPVGPMAYLTIGRKMKKTATKAVPISAPRGT
jgi:hypothetical protein